MGILLSSGQSLSPSRADFVTAAALLCFLTEGDADPIALSRCVSEKAGRPLLIVNLEFLPHLTCPGSTDCELHENQAKDHAKILKDLAEEAFPNGSGFPDDWNWLQSGQLHTVNSSSWRVNHPRPEGLPMRLSGDYWTRAAIITTANRQCDNRELWVHISGLAPWELEHYPKGDTVRAYDFGHEFDHALQSCSSQIIKDPSWQWETEIDSDRGTFAGFSLLAQEELLDLQSFEFGETIEGVIHGRALSAFRAALPPYWSALRLDGCENISYEKAQLCNYEIRFRTYAALKGVELPLSSYELQSNIKRWLDKEGTQIPFAKNLEDAFGEDWDWGLNNSPRQSIPVLHKILNNGEITDPLSVRNAQLVIDAALYFCPSVQALLPTKTFVSEAAKLPHFNYERPEISSALVAA